MNGTNTAPLDSLTQGGASALNSFSEFVGGSQTNVLYKAFVLVGALVVLALVPVTQKFAGYAAWIILALLLVQRNR